MSGAVWFLPLGSFSGLGRFPQVCIDSTADSRAESSESLQSSPGAQPSPLHILPCELWPPRPPAPSPARPPQCRKPSGLLPAHLCLEAPSGRELEKLQPQRRKPAGLLPAHLFGKRLPALSWRSCSPPRLLLLGVTVLCGASNVRCLPDAVPGALERCFGPVWSLQLSAPLTCPSRSEAELSGPLSRLFPGPPSLEHGYRDANQERTVVLVTGGHTDLFKIFTGGIVEFSPTAFRETFTLETWNIISAQNVDVDTGPCA